MFKTAVVFCAVAGSLLFSAYVYFYGPRPTVYRAFSMEDDGHVDMANFKHNIWPTFDVEKSEINGSPCAIFKRGRVQVTFCKNDCFVIIEKSLNPVMESMFSNLTMMDYDWAIPYPYKAALIMEDEAAAGEWSAYRVVDLFDGEYTVRMRGDKSCAKDDWRSLPDEK